MCKVLLLTSTAVRTDFWASVQGSIQGYCCFQTARCLSETSLQFLPPISLQQVMQWFEVKSSILIYFYSHLQEPIEKDLRRIENSRSHSIQNWWYKMDATIKNGSPPAFRILSQIPQYICGTTDLGPYQKGPPLEHMEAEAELMHLGRLFLILWTQMIKTSLMRMKCVHH